MTIAGMLRSAEDSARKLAVSSLRSGHQTFLCLLSQHRRSYEEYEVNFHTFVSFLYFGMGDVSWFSSRCRTYVSVCNQPPTLGQLSLPSLRGR